ncbi:unnamed protein product [Didymodactylos carnosus]|nr:unnamed protein product [Didymodactylos carnosus]CAF4421798.1 unnamed protein product [Didymodactylos carnosus]
MQGWRSSMEDVHCTLLKLDDKAWSQWSYFSIFDGHNGLDTARKCAEDFHRYLLKSFNEMLKHGEPIDGPLKSSQLDLILFRKTIKQTYFFMDEQLRKSKTQHDESGAVVITCLIGPEVIYFMNVGDARAILVSKTGQVLLSTHDHKTSDPDEQHRIAEKGGSIWDNRVEGQLAMTRVLGDFSMDKDLVPPDADIKEYTIHDTNNPLGFIVLACDGIWDVMSNKECAKFIVERMSRTQDLCKICDEVLEECLKRGSADNMTIYIIKFL